VTLFGLNKATKLRDVEFLCVNPSVQWIVATLRRTEIKTLRTISIVLTWGVVNGALDSEVIRQEWLTLDCLLVQFWNSRSLNLKLSLEWVKMGLDLGVELEKLFPESMRRGIVDLDERYTRLGFDWPAF
jgi:hypothetical protein